MNSSKDLVSTLTISLVAALGAVGLYHFAVVRPGPRQVEASEQTSPKVEVHAPAVLPPAANAVTEKTANQTANQTTETLTRIANDLDELYTVLNAFPDAPKEVAGATAADKSANMTREPLVRIADRMDAFLVTIRKGLTRGSENAKLNSLTSDLQTIRSQIQLYVVQHDDKYPTRFVEQMTNPTNVKGETVQRQGTDFGPYLPRSVPHNPFTNGHTVGNGPIGSSDWFYDGKTGEFRANDSKEHAGY